MIHLYFSDFICIFKHKTARRCAHEHFCSLLLSEHVDELVLLAKSLAQCLDLLTQIVNVMQQFAIVAEHFVHLGLRIRARLDSDSSGVLDNLIRHKGE